MRFLLIIALLLPFMQVDPSIEGQMKAFAASSGKYSGGKLQLRTIKIQGSGGRYLVTGQAKPARGSYFYTVEDGHNVLISEKLLLKRNMGAKWTPFRLKVSIPQEQLPANGTVILYAYERDEQGKVLHAYSIVLEKFYPLKKRLNQAF